MNTALRVYAQNHSTSMMAQQKHNSRPWLVYILRCGDGSLYTGITNDLPKRLQAHGDGTASRYTRSRLPAALVYLESAANRSAAIKRELLIKRMRRRQKELLIEFTPSSIPPRDN